MSKIGSTILCGMTLIAFVTMALAGGPPSGSEGAVLSSDGAVVDAKYDYVGTKKCRMCHSKQYTSLLESPKGRSWEALVPGVSQQVKIRAGLDVKTDYRTDGRCLKCHSVGYGEPGGYAVPNDRRSERLAAKREGVGCESCHGPGSGYVSIMQDILRNERSYAIEELRAKGRKTVGPEVCSKCHNDQAICMVGVDARKAGTNGTNGLHVSHENRSWLHVDVTDRHGFHAKFPFKYRTSEGAVRGDLPKERSSANGKPSDSLKGKGE